MTKGFIWIAQNNSTTDYVGCSVDLCKTIKKHCAINNVAIITDAQTRVPTGVFDHVIVMHEDHSKNIEWKMNNEFKVFELSPFTHSIKLEADMLWNSNTDWWWNHLTQHDLVFSEHCRDYEDNIIKNSWYRKIWHKNHLRDIYNGIHYFRRSQRAFEFYKLCRQIILHWETVKNEVLFGCHDSHPTTDIVYALANKIQDPLNQHFVTYDWFNFVHGKQKIHANALTATDLYNYLHPVLCDDGVFLGGYKQHRPLHYHEKNFLKEHYGRAI